MGNQVSKWAPTEEDLKDCGHCRGGWPLVLHNGYRAHRSSPDAEVTACYSTGPLRLAPPAPKHDYAKQARFAAKKFGFFMFGNIFVAIVVILVLVAIKGIHFVMSLLPGGVDQALQYLRYGIMYIALGAASIYGVTTAGEYLWNTFKKPINQEESNT